MTIEERLEKLELEMERRKAVTEIQNCIGRYEGVHKAMTMYLTPETFALTMPDVSMEVSDWGGFVGPEAIKFQLCAQLRVCNQVGGNPIYPRSSQPDNSESWDVVGNSN